MKTAVQTFVQKTDMQPFKILWDKRMMTLKWQSVI